ncbi:DUF4163 domain-containing protein [Cytobacillus solani]|uniref:DUF4163 domain-containing protein n=1 Tax=Cytobacillus solani TaxID=1637975 RepID=UPI00207AAE7D|nr:DUF4163 domain-containing protein [Cytobacillus solani]USK57151.1 DUF4163 domain-containing protein [Cytobacillus solani]
MQYRQLLKITMTFVVTLTLFLIPSYNHKTNATTPVPKFTRHAYEGNSLLLYPQVSGINIKAASKINSTLKGAAEKSYDNYIKLKKSEKDIPRKKLCKKTNNKCRYSYNSHYEVKYNSNGKLSIIYYDYVYTGGSKGKGSATMYNFDLMTGKHYKIHDILKTSCNYKKVQKYAFDYLSKHEPFSKSVSKLGDVTVNKNTQFSFAKDGIYLVYQENEFQSYTDGYPFIKIPKSVYK